MGFRKNTKTIQLFIFILLGMISLESWADSKDKSGSIYDNCVKKEGTINNGVVHKCSSIASESVKKEMNKLYDIIYKNISEQSPEDAPKFENSQKSWLKYRKTHCDLMGSYVGSPMYSFCPMQLNVLRVSELRELAGE